VPLQQTELGLKYAYGLYYYEAREHLKQRPIDQTHQLDLWVDHAFSSRWHGRVQDSFVVAQEPELLSPGGVFTTGSRVEGNNIVNNALVTLNTEWTQLLNTVLTYNNTYYDYQNSGGSAASPSLAGLLNRDEQNLSLDVQWRLQPETLVFVGAAFGQVNYLGGEPVSPGFMSDNRDSRSEYIYIGGQYAFTENLTVSAKAGGQFTQYYHEPNGNTSSIGPYADISATYTYMPGSYVQLGFTHQRNATDIIAPVGGQLTLDQETSVVYGSLNHQITPELLGSIIARYQNSVFNGGLFNNQTEDYYDLGFNFSYNFNEHWSAEIGYNYDNVSSPAGQSYSRNRGYLGVTATY